MQASTPAHRVLFVDDEPAILSGLSRVLRPLRHEIQSEFVASGQAALDILASKPFDMVIADMRMPGMDGATLLAEVQRRYPHVIRAILTGQSELTAALRAVPVAHQFIAKPCEAESLRAIITRAAALHELLNDAELQRLVTGMRELPVRPETYDEITRLLNDTSTKSGDIANVVERDAVLTAKLLNIVNSAFFGLARRITSPETAINYLGTTMLRSIILATAATETLGPRAKQLGYDLEATERQGLLSAKLATQFFQDAVQREDAFAAALLQDVGELLLIAEANEPTLAAFQEARRRNAPLWEVEREYQSVSHAAVGAYLLGTWGLPYPIVEAVAHHHDPGASDASGPSLPTAVYAGCGVAGHFLRHEPHALERANEHLAHLGMQPMLPRLVSVAEKFMFQTSQE